MVAFTILAALSILCAIGSLVTSIRIANYLRSRGKSAHPALVRWMIFKYMADYKKLTLEETGSVGPLYNQCSTISGLAALFALMAILVKIFVT
jgi:hypothetical protein